MGILKSAATTIAVVPKSTFTPPYSLPGPGQVAAIGLNTAYDITPTEMSSMMWSYSLFNSWIGGAVVTDYSPGGAWVLAGTGGHTSPANIGAAIFDFTDAKWKRQAPQGGKYDNWDYYVNQTSDDPYYELKDSGGVPSPAHSYQNLCVLPTAWGGGPKGSVIYVTRTAICRESRRSPACHRFDLATSTWSRWGQNLAPRTSYDSSAVIDYQRKCYWLLGNDQNAYTNNIYLDATDWKFKLTENYPYLPGPMESGRIWMHEGLLMRQARDGSLYAFNPEQPTLGFKQVGLNASLPYNQNSFCYFPLTKKFYYVDDEAGSSITRLSPPQDPWNGQWIVDKITVSPSLPKRTADGGTDPEHYNSLFYIPAIQRLAWIPGGGEKVYLVYPAS